MSQDFLGEMFAHRDSSHHFGQTVEMLGSSGSAHEANPHRGCVASKPRKKLVFDPQKSKQPYVISK